jgi:predicted transcriptional regulator
VNSNSAKSKPGRRDKFDIIARVIEICIDGARKTKVMHKSNLSFAQLNHYLRVTLEYDLLAKQINDKGKAILVATPKGLDFLQKYDEMLQILASETTRSPLI